MFEGFIEYGINLLFPIAHQCGGGAGCAAEFCPQWNVLDQDGAEVAALTLTFRLYFCGTAQTQAEPFENSSFRHRIAIQSEFVSTS